MAQKKVTPKSRRATSLPRTPSMRSGQLDAALDELDSVVKADVVGLLAFSW